MKHAHQQLDFRGKPNSHWRLFSEPPHDMSNGDNDDTPTAANLKDMLHEFHMDRYFELLQNYLETSDTFDGTLKETASWLLLLDAVRRDPQAPVELVGYVAWQRWKRYNDDATYGQIVDSDQGADHDPA